MFNYFDAVALRMGLFDRLRDDQQGDVSEKNAPSADFADNPDSYTSSPPSDASLIDSAGGQSLPPSADQGSGSEDRSDSLGISELMAKRTRLEDAVDYVGIMITNLREKRTGLAKEIEEESIEIDNIHEKLIKVQEYIDGERRGLETLKERRASVDSSANQAAERMNTLRILISELDGIVNSESNQTRSFKESQKNSNQQG